jgi:hypothetical protein
MGVTTPNETTEAEPIRMVTLINGFQIANALNPTGVSDKAILPDQNSLKREKLAELQKAVQKLKSTRKETMGRIPGFIGWPDPIFRLFNPSLDPSLQEILDKGKSHIDLLSLEELNQAIVETHEAEQYYRTNASKALPWILRAVFLTSAILVIGESLLKRKQRQNSLSK